MAAFIDIYRNEYGVEPICAVLPIAPSTYYSREAREADPTLHSVRYLRDEQLRKKVQRVWGTNFRVTQ